MSLDIEHRFSINRSRIFVAGFSGGARMASALAILAGNIAGAVGCGAGFTESYPANPQLNFVYAGLVGKGDMNYLEMKSIATQLTIFQIPNRIFIFEDGHQWPP